MPILKIEITNWRKQVLAGIFVALVHPLVYLVFDLFQGKPLSRSLWAFGLIALFTLVAYLLTLIFSLFSPKLHQIVADDAGLRFQYGRKWRRVAWTQVSTLERSMQPDGKTLKNCLILRDAGGQIMATWFREAIETPQLKTQFDELETLILTKIGTRGLIQAPLDTPLSKTGFVLQTGYKIIGIGSLFLWLPCAFFSWNHSTGGPVVGSLFLIFAALGLVLALSDSRYEIDERGVRAANMWKKRELRWEEIRRAEMLSGGLSIHFRGEKTALDVAGPANWGDDSAQLMLFLHSQFNKFGVDWEGNKALNWKDFFVSPDKRV
ncbi:MAG TPA: hypothetical protein VGB45_01915 [Abditibacterium sp.]|jgi:hypothetical protein